MSISFLMATVSELLATRLSQWNAASPVNLDLVRIDSCEIETGPNSEKRLLLRLVPVASGQRTDIHNILESTILTIDNTERTAVLRPSLWSSMTMRTNLREQPFVFIEYRFDSNATLVEGLDNVNGIVEAGTLLAHGVSVLKVGFISLGGGYLHPAVAIRVLASFSPPIQKLLNALVTKEPSDPFFLNVFLEFFADTEQFNPADLVVLRPALIGEYERVLTMNPAAPESTLNRYRAKLETYLQRRISYADMLAFVSAPSLELAFLEAPYRLWEIHDKALFLLAMKAEAHTLEVLDFFLASGGHPIRFLKDLTGLEMADYYVAFINPPFREPLIGGARVGIFYGQRGSFITRFWGLGDHWMAEKAHTAEDGGYYVAQMADGTLLFKAGRLQEDSGGPSLEEIEGYDVAIDNLTPIMLGGVPIDENDPQTRQWIASSIRAWSTPFIGITYFGRAIKDGKEYYVVLVKRHNHGDIAASHQEILDLLVAIGVRDCFGLDGSDSVMLIVRGEGVLEEPGFLKRITMPLAIGFRKKQ